MALECSFAQSAGDHDGAVQCLEAVLRAEQVGAEYANLHASPGPPQVPVSGFGARGFHSTEQRGINDQVGVRADEEADGKREFP